MGEISVNILNSSDLFDKQIQYVSMLVLNKESRFLCVFWMFVHNIR